MDVGGLGQCGDLIDPIHEMGILAQRLCGLSLVTWQSFHFLTSLIGMVD